MISSLSLRPAGGTRSSAGARSSARSMARPVPRTASRTARRDRPATVRPQRAVRSAGPVSWELRTFGVTALAIAAGFLLAVLYLGQITGLSVSDYGVQGLEARRDELRRQSTLLDVEIARLEAPVRLESEAARLGLVRLTHVPVMSAAELAARR